MRPARLRERTFGRRSGGAEHLGAGAQRDLQRRHADAAGDRVNQHAIARLDSGQVVQRVLRREERDGNGRRLGVRQHRRLANRQRRRGDHPCREAAIDHRDHVVADLQIVDTFADGRDDARAFVAERTRVAGVHAERVQHVAEVQPGRMHADLDLARTRTLALDRSAA